MRPLLKSIGILLSPILLFGCFSDDDDPLSNIDVPLPEAPPPPPAEAKLRITHASPDAPAVDILANDAVLAGLENVDYQVSSGWLTVEEGTYNVKVNGRLPGNEVATVIEADLTLDGDTSYDVLAINTVSEISPLVIANAETDVTAGNVRVQIVHAAPNAPEVDIYVTAPDTDIEPEQPVATAEFGQFTGQLEVPAGDYRIRITPAGSKTVVYDSGELPLPDRGDLLVAATDNVGAGGSPVTLLAIDATGATKLWDAHSGADLRVVHAVADAPAVDVIVDNAITIVDGAPFLGATDYLNVETGDYLIDVAADADNSLVVIDDASVTLEIGKRYTAIANNTLENIQLSPVVDTERSIATAAQVRIFHASPSAGDVDIYVTSNGDIADTTPAFTDVPFSSPMLTETGYVQLNEGDYVVSVTAAGTKDVALETGVLSLMAGRIYTAYAVDNTGGGLPPQLILSVD